MAQRVVKQYLVEVEADVDEWCQREVVDEGTALEQFDADAPQWLTSRMTELTEHPHWRKKATWKATELPTPAADLQLAVEEAIERGITDGAVKTWGGPRDKYVGLPPLQKRFAAYEAIATLRRHQQTAEVKPYTVCGFVDPNGVLHVTGVFEGQLRAVDSTSSIDFEGQLLEPFAGWYWATDGDAAAQMAYDHPDG